MSMYGVNGSIPKTLVRWLIDSTVETGMFPESSAVLKDILDTPISPELYHLTKMAIFPRRQKMR